MDNKKSTNQELEHLLRKGLEQVKQSPDGDLWEKIAARQQPQNVWLRLRHYALYVVPMLLVLGVLVAVWWHDAQGPQTLPTDAPPALRQVPENNASVPVADAETGEETNQPGLPAGGYQSAYQPKGAMRFNTVPGTVVAFDAGAGLHYQSPTTGTSVRIPANGLVDGRGRTVRGEVELLLREYRSIPDFLASGIPMHFADDRGEFFFNSGGMFELRVSQNGEALQMAPGQEYDLSFTATGALTNANLFYFDDDSGAWEYRPNSEFDRKADKLDSNFTAQARLVSASGAIRDNRRAANLPCLPQIAELPIRANPADFVRKGVQMGHDLATGKVKMPGWFRKRPWINNETLLNSIERGTVRIVRNRDQGELFFPEDLAGTYTELKAFKDCYFVRSADSISEKTELRTDITWDRVSISQDIGNKCNIWLYSEKEGLMQFYANLTASVGNKNFDAQQVIDEYKRLRAERLKNLETFADNLRKFLTVAPAFQTEDEWCLSQPEWLEYFETQLPQMAKRYADLIQAGVASDDTLANIAWENWRARVRECYFNNDFSTANTSQGSRENLTYALRLTNFGLYNCDQIFRLGQPRDYIYAAYQTPDGTRIEPASVSVLERNSRLFFTLPAANKMLNMPGRELDVVVADSDGRFYHLSSKDYARLRLGDQVQSSTFTVRDITDKTRTPRDWAEYLNM